MGFIGSQIEARKAYDRKLTGQAYDELAFSIGVRTSANPFFPGEMKQSDRVAAVCLHTLGVMPGTVPERIEDPWERVEWICRPSGTQYRRIKLEEKWYKRSFGVMMGILDSGEAVALLPRGVSGYHYQDPETDQMVRVTAKNAEKIGEEALLFYKPLPDGPVGKSELIRFAAGVFFNRTDFLALFLTALAATMVALLPPVANHIAFTTVIPSGMADLIVPVGILLLCAAVTSAMIGACRNLFMDRISQRLTVMSQAAFFSRIISLPVPFFRQFAPGDLASRVDCVSTVLQTGTTSILGAGLSVILALIFLFQIHVYAPALALPVFVITMVQLLIIAAALKSGTRFSQASMDASSRLHGTVASLLNGVQKLKLSGAEDRAFAKWAHRYAEYAGYTYNVPILVKAAPVFVALVGMLGVVWLYAGAASSGIGVSNYMAFSAAYGSITAAVTALAGSFEQMIRIRPMYSLLRPVLETCPETNAQKPGVESLTGRIEMSHIDFRYSEDEPYVLKNLSINIKAGEYAAIVGKSGCGKSTLMHLLLGMETPEKGSVFFDDYDVSTVDVKSLRRHLGVVLQDGGLFAGDLWSNITISCPGATPEDAWEAAEIAGIAEDIRKLPMGMNTLVSEGGSGFSGGQRQRILIARAICGKRRILLFDEATSALDNKTQKQVSDALEKLSCTRVVIAHRLSTVRNCDRILMLDEGKIAEEGTYEELMERKGRFYDLVKRQQIDL